MGYWSPAKGLGTINDHQTGRIAPMPSWPAVKGGNSCLLVLEKVCFRNVPSLEVRFLDRIVNSSTGPGQTVSLGKTFRAIGWTPLPDGFLQHALGFELNWVPCSVTSDLLEVLAMCLMDNKCCPQSPITERCWYHLAWQMLDEESSEYVSNWPKTRKTSVGDAL